MTNNMHFLRIILIMFFLAACLHGCEVKDFSEDYDISFPEFKIFDFSPKTALIGSECNITGQDFDKIFRVQMGGAHVQTFSLLKDTIGRFDEITNTMIFTDTIRFMIPRRIVKGPLVVENVYDYRQETQDIFEPTYPPVGIFVLPQNIERERRFKLSGLNIDLIKEVRIFGEQTDVTLQVKDDNATETEIVLLTVGINIPDSIVRLQFIPFASEIRILLPSGGISKPIPVIDPQPFDPVAPVIFWDFDGEIPLFDNKAAQFGTVAQAGINLAENKGVNKIRSNFFSVILDIVPVTPETDRGASWAYLGELKRENVQGGGAIDLSNLNDPHFTFLINTNNNKGYFQLEMMQEETKYGTHDMLDFQYLNKGWEWMSFRMEDLRWEKWEGPGPRVPNVNGAFEYIKIGYTTGDIPSGSYFEISLDEVMITDGPSLITDTMFIFEDGINRFMVTGTPLSTFESGINISAIPPFEGERYQTVKINNAAKQNEVIGEIKYNGPFTDPQYMNAPHVNLWVNTGSERGFLQLVAYEGTTRFIKNFGEISTGGKWQRMSVNLRAQTVPESGAMRKIDFSKLSSIGLLVTTGSASAGESLEINMDYITFSEGPAY